jgi:hypothetical protein
LQIASIVLPRFHPTWICSATWVAGGNVCDHTAIGQTRVITQINAVRLIDN